MLIGQEITVLGGGIGGLAAACALAARGASVRVLERAPEIAEVGAGLQISPNGVAVLRAIGAFDLLEAKSRRSENVTLRDAQGRQVLAMDLRGQGDFLLCHRADIVENLLARALELGVSIDLGADVTLVTLSEGAAPTLHFADGHQETAQLLIGADGVRSVVRQALLGQVDPFFTGQVAWRAMVPIEQGSVPDGAQVFMGPGRHLVAYPLRDGRTLNIVAVEERAEWADEGWAHHGDPDHLRAAFAKFAGPVPVWLEAVQEVGLWGLFRHPVAAKWQGNGCALLGDAAHPPLPFLAQGANLALEDAWVLAQALSNAEHSDALLAYENTRKTRATRVIEAANGNARNYHLRHPLVRFVAHTGLRVLSRVAPRFMPDRFKWLYDHDVTRQDLQ